MFDSCCVPVQQQQGVALGGNALGRSHGNFAAIEIVAQKCENIEVVSNVILQTVNLCFPSK